MIARFLTRALEFDDPALMRSGVEILDVTQTARINENNQFVVKSTLSADAVMAALQNIPAFRSLRAGPEAQREILDRVLGAMIETLGIDSCLHFGSGTVPPLAAGLVQATADTSKPLLLFNAASAIDFAALDPRWLDADHPAIWLGRDWTAAMDGTEAFFAISPELKLEVGLNRYRTLARFGDFAVGMVRL